MELKNIVDMVKLKMSRKPFQVVISNYQFDTGYLQFYYYQTLRSEVGGTAFLDNQLCVNRNTTRGFVF